MRQPMLKLKTHSGFHDLFLKCGFSGRNASLFGISNKLKRLGGWGARSITEFEKNNDI
jgi:hypothetical protein